MMRPSRLTSPDEAPLFSISAGPTDSHHAESRARSWAASVARGPAHVTLAAAAHGAVCSIVNCTIRVVVVQPCMTVSAQALARSFESGFIDRGAFILPWDPAELGPS